MTIRVGFHQFPPLSVSKVPKGLDADRSSYNQHGEQRQLHQQRRCPDNDDDDDDNDDDNDNDNNNSSGRSSCNTLNIEEENRCLLQKTELVPVSRKLLLLVLLFYCYCCLLVFLLFLFVRLFARSLVRLFACLLACQPARLFVWLVVVGDGVADGVVWCRGCDDLVGCCLVWLIVVGDGVVAVVVNLPERGCFVLSRFSRLVILHLVAAFHDHWPETK